MQTLSEMGPSKLLQWEQDQIRHAADNMIFSRDLADDEPAREALSELDALCTRLVASGRWLEETAMRLVSDVAQCGPAVPVELKAA